MNRRSILTAALAAPIAAHAIPAAAEVLPPSPLAALWSELKEAVADFEASDSRWFTPRWQAERDRITRLEKIAANYKPQTVEDMAWKILFAHADEEYIATVAQDTLVWQAKAIVGLV